MFWLQQQIISKQRRLPPFDNSLREEGEGEENNLNNNQNLINYSSSSTEKSSTIIDKGSKLNGKIVENGKEQRKFYGKIWDFFSQKNFSFKGKTFFFRL